MTASRIGLSLAVGLFEALLACSPIPPGMVPIPAGIFVMGSNAEDVERKAVDYGLVTPWFADEHPERRVALPAYYLDRYEVTAAEYQTFVLATGRPAPPGWMSAPGGSA